MKTRMFSAAVVRTCFLAGCPTLTPITVDRDSFDFKGNVPPTVFSRDALSENLAN